MALLRVVTLSELNHIPSAAFKVGTNNWNDMISFILNDNNKLDSSSFELGALVDLSWEKRGIELRLQNNQITYLEEKIFRPFLEKNQLHLVILNGNSLDCDDKRSAWIL